MSPGSFLLDHSPIGPLLFSWSDKGLTSIDFAAAKDAGDANANHPLAKMISEQFKSYFAGHPATFQLPVDWSGMTGFQKCVLEKLAQVPFGQTLTYGQLASQCGNAKASRAVGSAMARNPLPILLPCHRVLASGGRLGGYSGGLKIKVKLLELEGLPVKMQANTPK